MTVPMRFDETALFEAREAVLPLARSLDIAARLEPYAEFRWTAGMARRPVLHVEDVSGIPFVSVVPGVEEYQHRARARAGTGDLFAAVTPPAEGFEDYCREQLHLGTPECVLTEPGPLGFDVARACASGPALERIAARAVEAGGMLIHPYMAIQEVWDLASAVRDAAEVPVTVLGPPPPVLWVANDKATFTEVVSATLGADWIVETHAATSPAEMVEHLIMLAGRHARVGLKRTRCASGVGNSVYDLEAIRDQSPARVLEGVRSFLERTEWAGDEQVLIVAWEKTDVSPSTQLWIPPMGSGPPVVEGVYEQLLEGSERVFLGSRPSLLAEPVNAMLAGSSLRVGAALQSLGYVGRCSFDFILIEGADGEPRVKFIECNGRWGGTSTPMHLVDRIVPGPRPPYRAQDYMHRDLIGLGFAELLRRVGDAAYDPATRQGRYILYNVGPLKRSGKFDVIAVGATPDDAERAIRDDLPRRLGLKD